VAVFAASRRAAVERAFHSTLRGYQNLAAAQLTRSKHDEIAREVRDTRHASYSQALQVHRFENLNLRGGTKVLHPLAVVGTSLARSRQHLTLEYAAFELGGQLAGNEAATNPLGREIDRYTFHKSRRFAFEENHLAHPERLPCIRAMVKPIDDFIAARTMQEFFEQVTSSGPGKYPIDGGARQPHTEP